MTFDKPAHKIQDAALDIDELSHYTLSMMLSRRTIRLCVVDHRESRCLLLEDYRGTHIQSEDELLAAIQQLYENHTLLQAGYWGKIQLAIRSTPFTWVPQALFDIYQMDLYLRRTTAPGELITTDHSRFIEASSLQAYCVFAAPSALISWFQSQYLNQSIEVYHQAQLFAETILRNTRLGTLPQKALHIYGEAKYLLVVAIKEGNIHLINAFPQQAPEDFVYFTLFSLDELNLPAHEVPVILYGEISPKAKNIEKLRVYIKHLQFSDRPSHLSFSYQFDEVLNHRYFDLLNMHLFS